MTKKTSAPMKPTFVKPTLDNDSHRSQAVDIGPIHLVKPNHA